MKLIRDFWRLAAPFWLDRRQWPAWLLLTSVIGIGLLIVQVNVWINAWSRTFYDTLGAFDTDALYGLIGQYAGYLALYVVVVVAVDWLRKALELRWRRALTTTLIDRWLAGQAFYRLGQRKGPDNPDQRIAEDVDRVIGLAIQLFVSLILNLAQVGAFVVVLWELSGVQRFTLVGHEFVVQGYLVWVAVLYTLLGSLLTHWIGRPLHGLNMQREHREADLRADLLRKREHAEQIALLGGEANERAQLLARFEAIAGNWRRLMGRERDLMLVTTSYDRLSLIIPVFAALPAFLAKTITLGGLMQIRSAFSAVQGSLSWFIKIYEKLMHFSAAVQRLVEFEQAIAATREQARAPQRGDALRLEGLVPLLPDGQALTSPLHATLRPGRWLRLAGNSGAGKSTLLRTLHGLWPHYRGQWQLPAGDHLLLPQKPYLPTVALRELLAYPGTSSYSDSQLQGVLETVDLASWCDRLDHIAEWPRLLSGGEQQRIGIARALLARPDTLYLDEATSHLDDRAALALLQRLRQALPGLTLVAVTHQPALAGLFDEVLELNPSDMVFSATPESVIGSEASA